jgi:hypothetical protein
MHDDAKVVRDAMLDRYFTYDGWSVQVDLQQLEGGKQRYVVTVYENRNYDEWPADSKICDTLGEALQLMGPILEAARGQ